MGIDPRSAAIVATLGTAASIDPGPEGPCGNPIIT
jgi:hypothetical protein